MPDSANTMPIAPWHDLPLPLRQAWNMVAQLPFENLSKIVAWNRSGGHPEQALRLPDVVLAEYRGYGTGGTCFALVCLFQHLLERAGIRADSVLCDRYGGPDSHAAALVTVGTTRWIFDPGFHVVQPLPSEGELACRLPDNPNASRIRRLDARRYECFTGHKGQWRLRFVLKNHPVSHEEFRRAWAASFRVDMMGYPVLNRFEHGRMTYLQKAMLVRRDLETGGTENIPVGNLADTIGEVYGIDREFARRALRLMRRG